jgi:hypothetical protein
MSYLTKEERDTIQDIILVYSAINELDKIEELTAKDNPVYEYLYQLRDGLRDDLRDYNAKPTKNYSVPKFLQKNA